MNVLNILANKFWTKAILYLHPPVRCILYAIWTIHWTSLWLVNKAILVSLYNHTTKWSMHLHSVWSKQPWPNAPPLPFMAKPIGAQYHLSNHRHVPQHIHGSTSRNRSITLLTSHINIRHSTTAQMIHEDTKNMMEWERQSIGQTLSEETLKEKRTNAQKTKH